MERYLVAINYDGPHDRLAAEVRALALGDDAQFHIVVPAVDGDLGDANLLAAISDELDRIPYDVLVISTPPIGEHEQTRLVDHLVRLYGLPVVAVTATAPIEAALVVQ